jgi:transporter family-2 protein
MTSKVLWILLTFVAGAMLPIQGGLNARMGKALESPVYSSLISFVIGTIVLVAYVFITRQPVAWAGLKNVPGFVWIAGALGAFYVTVIILAFPRLGPALTFGLVVAGQMFIALFLDHFNILVAQQHSINIWRVFGVVLILTGVIIIRKF